MPDYENHWRSLLTAKGTEGIDLIASLSEETINAFLRKHFEADSQHYHKKIAKTFNDGTTLRDFA